MSEKNQKIRHLSDCQASIENSIERCAIIDSSPKMPPEKRKEEARKQIYLKRI